MPAQNACDSYKSLEWSDDLSDDVCVLIANKGAIMQEPSTRMSPGGSPATDVFQAELELNDGNHFRLRAVRDMFLTSVRGVAWITVDGEAGETMVSPGEAFLVASGKTALIGPLHQSTRLQLRAAT